jgi:hypothetical protein
MNKGIAVARSLPLAGSMVKPRPDVRWVIGGPSLAMQNVDGCAE